MLGHDSGLDLIGAIRENTAALNGWRNNYDTQQEFSKGQGTSTQDDLPGGTWGWWRKNAYGLDRVPYDDFPALLHEGERVLTAQQAREADSKPGRSISITITGNQFGAGVSAEEIAQRLADQIELKFAAGGLS